MDAWLHEIEELHSVFEAYFLGRIDSLDRVEASLAPGFTIVGPDGIESSRAETMQALKAGHAHTDSLVMTITEPQLVLAADGAVVARYIENHQLQDRSNQRWATVVFSVDAAAPNGLLWERVHETWIDRPPAD